LLWKASRLRSLRRPPRALASVVGDRLRGTDNSGNLVDDAGNPLQDKLSN